MSGKRRYGARPPRTRTDQAGFLLYGTLFAGVALFFALGVLRDLGHLLGLAVCSLASAGFFYSGLSGRRRPPRPEGPT